MRALILLMVFLSSPAFAYVNPGAGITFLGAVLGFLAALLFVVIGLVLWPIRRYLQHKKAQQAAEQQAAEQQAAEQQAAEQQETSGQQDPPAPL